ncbi:MAG: hypothetical protein ACLQDY_02295 [Streptosporangiaceae bacterium]
MSAVGHAGRPRHVGQVPRRLSLPPGEAASPSAVLGLVGELSMSSQEFRGRRTAHRVDY